MLLRVHYHRYVELNIKCSGQYRKYNKAIPGFLTNKPRILVAHCMERSLSAQDYEVQHVQCIVEEVGLFSIKSQTREEWYSIRFGDVDTMPQCDCLDWKRWCLPCKHFLAVFQHYPNWQWEQLSVKYTGSPFLSLDDDLVNQLMQEIEDNEEGTSPNTSTVETLSTSSDVSSLNQSTQSLSTSPDSKDSPPTVDIPATSDTSSANVINLPKRTRHHQTDAAQCRDILAQIRNATFLSQDAAALHELKVTLLDALQKIRGSITQEDGLEMEHPQVHHGPPKPKQPQKLGKLPRPPKRKTYTGRVGEKASINRKLTGVKSGIDNIPWSQETGARDPPESTLDDGIQQPTPNKSAEEDVIFIGESTGTAPKRKRRILPQDEVEITNGNGMLTDISINIAQNLLHEQVPHVEGLEDTVLGPAGNFSIAEGEFIQIVHDGGAHWVCVSNIGCRQGVINYFDSLNRGQIKRHVQRQVQSIVHGIGQEVMITIQPVQQQQNSVDCGIFAIAFATSLAYGQNPAATTYDTSRIRPHLSACLATGHLSTFPVLTTEHCQRCSKKYVLLKM